MNYKSTITQPVLYSDWRRSNKIKKVRAWTPQKDSARVRSTVANGSHWTIPTLLQEQISNIQLFCSALGRIDDVALANFTTTSSTVHVRIWNFERINATENRLIEPLRCKVSDSTSRGVHSAGRWTLAWYAILRVKSGTLSGKTEPWAFANNIG